MVVIEDISEDLPLSLEKAQALARVLARALALKDQGNDAFKAKEWEQVRFECDITLYNW
jgi:hypothetical protein